jgi:hypothetical protein
MTRSRLQETNLVSSHHLSGIDIETNQIPSCHETKMFPKRVHPNIVFKFRISDRDMAGLAFCEAFPGEVTEYRRSMNENMLSMFMMR